MDQQSKGMNFNYCSLELQISNLMDENKDLNKRVSKLDDVFKAQNYIEQRIN